MQVDYLIIGQGVSGTALSWFLHQEGKSFVVLDEEREATPSRVAAGLINPVTGRHYFTSWKIDAIMPFAVETYRHMESMLNLRLVQEKSVVDFFPTVAMREAFIGRIDQGVTYLHPFPDQNHFNQFFNYDFGCGEIRPAFAIHLRKLIDTWRAQLNEKGMLREGAFDREALRVSDDKVEYEDITASMIIFCEGPAGTANPWFDLLPFSPNKGEALVIESSELNNQHIFKRGHLLVPLPEPGTFWVGANYQWNYEDAGPTEAYRKQITTLLEGWLKVPFRVVDHKAAVRPATIERRPFVGLHPVQPNVAILNGMGSKGTSLAPYFAKELVEHLLHGAPLTPEADVRRFSRILSK